jgi:hypothetical protein
MQMKHFYKVIYFTVIVLVLTSCKLFMTQNKTPDLKVIFPTPPDTARIQFLKSISTSQSLTGEQSKFKTFIFGKEEVKDILKPSGVFIRYGKIYLCDIGLKGLEIIDLEKGRFEYFIPEGKGELKLPISCYVDERNWLYIADGKRQQIIVFDESGKYVTSFGENENFKPTALFVSDGKIWVANIMNHKILVYDKTTYQLLKQFPDIEPGAPGYLYQPTYIWVTNDRYYVSDFGDFRIKTYNQNFEFVDSIGSYGKMPGQFVRPKGIAVDRDNYLYVVDAAFENVQIFNDQGEFMMPFGGPYTGPGYMNLPIGIVIDYDNLKYFETYVDPDYKLKYLILVSNQYGPDKLNIYGRIEPKIKP